MPFRARKQEIKYKKYQQAKKATDCDFCAFHLGNDQVVREEKYFWIVKNIFPYSIWEGLNVVDHLMIIPKRHIDALQHFNAAELQQYGALVAEYDADGYSSYTRSHQNVSKSIPHQHTHLLKLGDRYAKTTFYLQRPYIFWFR